MKKDTSLVATVRHLPAGRVAELGRPILLNPSCPTPPPGVEHAKKPAPEPFRALPTWPAENNGVDNPCPPKETSDSAEMVADIAPTQSAPTPDRTADPLD